MLFAQKYQYNARKNVLADKGTIEKCFKYDLNSIEHIVDRSGIDEVKILQKTYNINNINLLKPGIGETTRVLLRRVPWKVLIVEDYRNSIEVEHIIQLAKVKCSL